MFSITILFVLLVGVYGGVLDNGGRIVGGEPAATGQFPYQVSLQTSSQFHFCGGSLLSERWILSAAHCLLNRDPAGVYVAVGITKLSETSERYQGSLIITHPFYNSYELKNDTGLLRVNKDIIFNDLVQKIKLGAGDIGSGADLLLSGWGSTSYPRKFLSRSPDHLQFIKLKSLSVKECQDSMSSAMTISDSEICSFTEAGEGACHGDSGSPVTTAKFEQVGIVSWGMPCANGYPDVHTRVSSFYDWITAEVGRFGEKL